MSERLSVELEMIRGGRPRRDDVAVERPLEIRVGTEPFAVVMRTPGHDDELAAGLMWSEGVVADASTVLDVRHCISVPAEMLGSVVVVELSPEVGFDASRWQRRYSSSSACGVCGKLTLESVRTKRAAAGDGPRVDARTLLSLPARMQDSQPAFARTGGLHAAALFDAQGDLLCVREDIGRHNAVDKVIGWALFAERLPLTNGVLLVSGRAGFEIVDKASKAGIVFVASLSAPSSMAVEMARESGMTLVGFLRGDTFNVYADKDRILPDSSS